MPQNKNLTQIWFSEGGFGKKNGVINAGKKGADQEAVYRKVSYYFDTHVTPS
jgi:hypothetical protein